MKYIIVINIILLFFCILSKILGLSILISHLDEFIQVYNQHYSAKSLSHNTCSIDIIKNSISLFLLGRISLGSIKYNHIKYVKYYSDQKNIIEPDQNKLIIQLLKKYNKYIQDELILKIDKELSTVLQILALIKNDYSHAKFTELYSEIFQYFYLNSNTVHFRSSYYFKGFSNLFYITTYLLIYKGIR